jgi:alkaline phosphatase D
MSLSRRQFIVQTVGAGALVSFVGACDDGGSGDGESALVDIPVDKTAFAHGVASGDPAKDSVLLWTRVSGQTAAVSLTWVIAKDAALSEVVAMGDIDTSDARDFTVKVVASGLGAGSTYYYAFFLDDNARSVIGRTRTLPEKLDHARIAFTSCANYGYGYFHAYRNIAARADLDVWIHLGDYIYEYDYSDYSDPSIPRTIDPMTECYTLSDYRRRYASWHRDIDLQEIHRQHPLIVVWDDHEVANNAWQNGAENHQADEGDYQARKKAGEQAFLEWLPIRVEPTDGNSKIYREFAYGDLFDLMMLDTRQLARSEQAGTDAINPDNLTTDVGDPEVWADPTRTLLGAEQEAWFKAALTKSQQRKAKWRLIGNQVIFARLKDFRTGGIFLSDTWDGYQVSQKAILDHIAAGIDNVVFLTGDIHTSWALEIAQDPFDTTMYNPETGEGSIAVELVGPSVTSQALEGQGNLANQSAGILRGSNNHLKFYEATRKGYVLVDLTAERMQAEYYFVSDIKKTSGSAEALAELDPEDMPGVPAIFTCQSGSAHLVLTDKASAAKKDPPALAPEE